MIRSVIDKQTIPDWQHALVGESIVVVFVQSPGHAKVSNLDGLIASDEAIPTGDVAVDETHFVEVFKTSGYI